MTLKIIEHASQNGTRLLLLPVKDAPRSSTSLPNQRPVRFFIMALRSFSLSDDELAAARQKDRRLVTLTCIIN